MVEADSSAVGRSVEGRSWMILNKANECSKGAEGAALPLIPTQYGAEASQRPRGGGGGRPAGRRTSTPGVKL